MTFYKFSVTIPASGAAAVNLAAAAIAAGAIIQGYTAMFSATWLPASRILLQNAINSTGFIFIGGPNVTSAGLNQFQTLKPASPTTNPGDNLILTSEVDYNNQDLSQFNLHGSHAGDVVNVTYAQE